MSNLILLVTLTGLTPIGWQSDTLTCDHGSVTIEDVLVSIDRFLDAQLSRFDVPMDYPEEFAGVQLIQTFDAEITDPRFGPLLHRADIYDTSVAAIYSILRGDLARARTLLDAVLFVQDIDPRADGRTRVSYWANDLLTPDNSGPSIDDWRSSVGNLSWQGIALLRMFQQTKEMDKAKYIEAARRTARWMNSLEHAKQTDECGGYSLGKDREDNRQTPFGNGRSTEHNVDAYVFASNLCSQDDDPANAAEWIGMAQHARRFVQRMFDENEGKYWIGTKNGDNPEEDEIEINFFPVPTDAQTWTTLASIDEPARQSSSMQWLDTNLREDQASLSAGDQTCTEATCDACNVGETCCQYHGLLFTNGGEGIHSEVSAGAALAFSLLNQPGNAEALLCNLDFIRLTAHGHDPNGTGVVMTPSCDGGRLGLNIDNPSQDRMENLRHVASTVWLGLALLAFKGDEEANPLRSLPQASPLTQLDVDGDGDRDLADVSVLQLCADDIMRPLSPCCSRFDIDSDGILTLEDVAALLETLSGPGS